VATIVAGRVVYIHPEYRRITASKQSEVAATGKAS